MPLDPVGDDGHVAAWEIRYRDPARFAAAVEALPPGPITSYLRAHVACVDGRTDECLRLCEEAEAGVEEGSLWHARVLETRAIVLADLGLDHEAAEGLTRARELYRRAGDRMGAISTIQNLATLGYQSEETSLALYREALAMVDEREMPDLAGVMLLNLQFLEKDLGTPLPERVAQVDRALALLTESWPGMADEARCVQVDLALEGGDVDEARRLATRLPRPVDVPTGLGTYVAETLARVRLADDDAVGAADLLQGALERGTLPEQRPRVLAQLARTLLQAGRADRAAEVALDAYEEVLQEAEDTSTRSARALDVWHRTSLLRQEREQERERADALERALEELRAASRRIHELSIRDTLTGLHNRQHLLDAGTAAVAVASPALPAQVALVDLDGFKGINDTYGHTAGDVVLRTFAHLLTSRLGPTDLVARYGGEEFVVVRPPAVAGGQSLTQDLDALRAAAADARPTEDGRTLPGTRLSAGVVLLEGPDLQAALKEADMRMYAAKRDGGDRVYGPREPGPTSVPVPPDGAA